MAFSSFRCGTFRPLLFILALACLSGGCGDGGPKLVPVKGKVSVNGKPLTSGSVIFKPDKSKGNTFGGEPMGELNEQGEYTLQTVGKPGAPLGAYKVTVTSSGPITPDNTKVSTKSLVNNTYLHYDTTPLTAEVVSSPGPEAYDFKLTP